MGRSVWQVFGLEETGYLRGAWKGSERDRRAQPRWKPEARMDLGFLFGETEQRRALPPAGSGMFAGSLDTLHYDVLYGACYTLRIEV